MHIGFGELLVIIIICLAMFRPEKLKDYSKKLGETMRSVQSKQNEMKDLVELIQDAIKTVQEDTSL